MQPNKPLKVLFISSRANLGAGGETYLLSVLHHIDRERVEPVVVLPKDGSLTTVLAKMDVPVEIVGNNYNWLQPPEPWYRLLGGLRPAVDALRQVIADRQIDLVHTNSNFRLEGALAARLNGIHHLYLAHIEFQPEMPVFQRFRITPHSFAQLMGELSSGIIAVSESVAATLSPMVPAEKIRVVHNGIELKRIDVASQQAGSIRAELGLPEDAILVAAVGRMNPDKGFDLFVEAAGLITAKTQNVHFLLVGGSEVDSYERDIKQRILAHGLEPRFHMLGHRTDVPGILRQSDIFVLSSRREGHPYVMLEAMASRCAVVACACAGVRETLVDGENGFILEVGDVEGIADRVLQLVNNSNACQQIAANARFQIEKRFQAHHTAEQLMQTYETLFATEPPTPGAPAIDLFLQTATEIGALGRSVNELESRLQKVEKIVALFSRNPVARSLRALKNRLSG